MKNIKRSIRRDESNTRISDKDKIIFAIILFIIFILSFLKFNLFIAIMLVFGPFVIAALGGWLKKLKKNPKIAALINILLTGIIIAIVGIAIFTVIIAMDIIKTAPDFNKKLLNKPDSSIIYDQDNKIIGEIGDEKRDNIKYQDISENLINAIVATEDSRFFQHHGFDGTRFLSATFSQLLRRNSGGASTLDMQVVKNTYTDAKETKRKGLDKLKRKFTDIYLAVYKLEKDFSKREILEFYVNNHQLHPRAFGVEKTAQLFFGKSAKDLTLSEAAVIAGMFQAPSSYNPFLYPERTEKRRNTVLYLMERHGYISKEEREAAQKISVESLLNKNISSNKYQSFIDTMLDELKEKGYDPYKESLEIYTTLDSTRQENLEKLIDKEYRFENEKLQVASTATDTHTGQIKAIYSGRYRKAGDFNLATKNYRQIGSTAKPLFDYGPGMEYNNWSTYTIFEDKEYKYSDGTPISNHDNSYMGNMTLCDALAWSRNIPALKAFQQVDNRKIYNFVTSLGITPQSNNGRLFEAHAIGAFNGTSSYQLSSAYSAFANGGTYYKPYTIRSVRNKTTGEKKDYQPEGKKVMSDSTAFMINYCLEYNANNAFGRSLNPGTGTFAIKTGTTNFSDDDKRRKNLPNNAINDLWAAAYDPDLSVSIWYGYTKIIPGYVSTNASWPRFYDFVRNVGRKLFKGGNKRFNVPNSVVKVDVEFPSNPPMLASASTPASQRKSYYFKKGTEPTETSVKYSQLPNVTGLTANKISTNVVKLTWNAATNPSSSTADNSNYGRFGYRIYKDNNFIGFTTNTNFTYTNSDYVGTYKVVTCFENLNENQSSGSTAFVNGNFQTSLKVPSNTVYSHSGPEIPQPSASDIEVKLDGNTITNYTVRITITRNGSTVTTIHRSMTGNYTIKYDVVYNSKIVSSIQRTATVH